MSEARAKSETGIAFISPLFWLGVGELVGPVLDEVFSALPSGDAAALPFASGGGDGCGGFVYQGDKARAVGTIGGVTSEYAEAFSRLDALLSLARGCATDRLKAAELSELRSALARALNAGIYEQETFDGDRVLVCKGAERPTRGQVRAWLAALATALGRICADAELSAAAGTVAKPLDVPAAPKSRVVGLSPVGWAAVAAAVVGAVLLWRAS